eukprot:44262-Chlamydomonas_euryale.AAC.8
MCTADGSKSPPSTAGKRRPAAWRPPPPPPWPMGHMPPAGGLAAEAAAVGVVTVLRRERACAAACVRQVWSGEWEARCGERVVWGDSVGECGGASGFAPWNGGLDPMQTRCS